MLTLNEKLGESLAAEVFLAKDDSSETPVIVKKIRADFTVVGLREHLEQQQAYLQQLNIKQLVVPEIQIDNDGALLLVQPKIEGQVLSAWLANHAPVDITTLLEIGIALADCLNARHNAVLIHKAVKPSNILIQENPIRIHLIDDIRVSDSSQFSRFVQDPQFRRDTLPYLAPEQTGRIRLEVNYCSDLYAVGIVLYECLTGKPPFFSEDPLAIIHSHLAEVPTPISELNPNCPAIINDIIATLLKKSPEKRYHSASGLKADLQTSLVCLQCEDKTHCSTCPAAPLNPLSNSFDTEIPKFVLKQKDFSNQISIPSIMVGRDQQKKQLLNEYQRVCTGQFGFVMVSGVSGIGKTRLIQELERPIVAQRGYFASGKFNQYNRHRPFSTLTEALNRLLRLFLTEDAERIAYWQKRIRSVVGIDGQLLTDSLPALTRLIGEQPMVVPLPPAEAQNRLTDLCCRFIACLASAEHPLVLFIDDMQWCDSATFDLLSLILSRPQDFPYVLIIGAYRKEEVDENHRVIRMEKTFNASNQSLLKLQIDSLSKQSANEMIAFILNTVAIHTQELTEYIYPISGGSPLFISESLRWLHSNNALSLSEKGTWTWNADSLSELTLPSNADALLHDKFKQFPERVISLLANAALLGTRFDARDLAEVTQTPAQELYALLSDVFTQGVLLRSNNTLSFPHDKFQAAAAGFLNNEQRQQCHKRIAHLFIDQGKNKLKYNEEKLFAIVEHLRAGRTTDETEVELIEEAQFNYQAGVASMDSLALEASIHYFSRCAGLCPDRLWLTDHGFMFDLYKKLARVTLINGDHERSEKAIKIALKHAQSDLDKAECLYEQTVTCASMGDVDRVIDYSNKVLKILNRSLPETDKSIRRETSKILAMLHENRLNLRDMIEASPIATNRQAILESNLYAEMLPVFHNSGRLFHATLLSARSVEILLENGIIESCTHSLSLMALLFQIQGDYTTADQYEKYALEIAQLFPTGIGTVRTISSIMLLTAHDRLSAEDIITLGEQNIGRGTACGELQCTAITYNTLIWINIIQSNNFPIIQKNIENGLNFTNKYSQLFPHGVIESTQLAIAPLWESKTSVSEAFISSKLKSWRESQHIAELLCFFVFSSMVEYFQGNYKEAQKKLRLAEPCLTTLTNSSVERLWTIFSYLADLQNGEPQFLEVRLQKVTQWAQRGPLLRPYLALMQAETTATQGDIRNTRISYLDAIDIAHQQGYVFLEAFLNERLSQHLEKENHFSSETYRTCAITLYQSCGALVKVAHLSETSRVDEPVEQLPTDSKAVQKKEEVTPDSAFDNALDYNYLLDSVKAITGELDFNKLLELILGSVMAKLGAETGYLLVSEKDNLVPHVCGTKQDELVIRFRNDPAFSCNKLSMGIARYVFRTGETVILDDASVEGNFVADEVVQNMHLHSVLCLPLIKQNQTLGVLYLENSLINSVFSADQVELAKLLTAQASTALQNAALLKDIKEAHDSVKELNESLELRVQQRTIEIAKVNEELNSFAYAVSHDLKAPLRGITQLSSWLLEDNREQLDESGREMLDLLQRRAKQMYDMIEGILEFSRVGRVKELSVLVDLNKLVNDVADLIAIPDSITFSVETNLPTVRREEALLVHVFQNLIDNAAKHMDKERGEIGVSCIEEAEAWQFCIADNGPGIDKRHQNKIFKMFQTLKPKDDSDSTGIGLALVQKIVNNWGGHLWLESENTKGSKFFFSIPKNGEIE